MEPDDLLLHLLLDLDRRTRQPASEFDMLGISAQLRQLLLDGTPLLDQVNRERRLRMRYRVNRAAAVTEREWPEGLQPSFHWTRTISPHTAPMAGGEELLTRDRFLGLAVIRDGEQTYSIHEVIDVCAQVLGGLHSGGPKTPSESALRDIGKAVRINDSSSVIYMLPAISTVVLEVAKPLFDLIAGERA